MKKTYLLIATAIFAVFSIVSCKNGNKTQEPSQEEVQQQKQELCDSVLAIIDNFANEYFDASSKNFTFQGIQLTDAEKLARPDYLLDPPAAKSLVTKSQKINALGILITDMRLMYLYGMPVEEAKETIAKLAAEVNLCVESEKQENISMLVKNLYNNCKENNRIPDFWQLENAMLIEITYIFSQNPDLFLDRISDEQWSALNKMWLGISEAVDELAKYDQEMASLAAIMQEYEAEGETDSDYVSKDSAKQRIISVKEIKAERRNALLE